MEPKEAPKRKRPGRPKGSKNKTAVANGNARKTAQKKREAELQAKEAAETKKKGRGRPSIMTDEKRAVVERAAKQGLPQQFIADLIGVSKDTLKKHCSKELAEGYAAACDEINKLTWAEAKAGNTAALLHLRKVLFGEHDKLDIAVTGTLEYVIEVGDASPAHA